MGGKRARGTLELNKPQDEISVAGAAGAPPLGRRIFSVRNIASFLLAVAVLYLMYREFLGVDWGETWVSVWGANAWLFALAFVTFYCSFPLRALRWKALLANVGYSREAGRPIPSTLGLTRIMYTAWFANCVTIARLGDAYPGYLLKREAGVSFAVTLGTILAERLLDLLVLATMMGAGLLVVFTGSFRSRLPQLVFLSVAGWVLEGAALYATVAAVGVPVSVAGALVVALAASLLSTVPITPAGLGVSHGGQGGP